MDSRLSGSLDGEEVETDQDYALVVEEGALSATDPQDGGSPEEVIDAYLQGEDFAAGLAPSTWAAASSLSDDIRAAVISTRETMWQDRLISIGNTRQ